MGILRLDIRQLIAGVCYLTLDRIHTPVLGGIDIYHGFCAVTLCIAVVTLIFTDTGRVTLQDPLCGIVEAVVFIHIVSLVSSLITKGPDHYGWMVFIALYHILGAVHNGSIPDRISGRDVAACRTDVGLCIRLITDINTQLICQSVHIWIVRIMAGTDRIDIELFHHLQIGCDIFSGDSSSVLVICFMTVCTTEHDLFTVDLYLFLTCFVDICFADLAESDSLNSGLHDIAVFIF